VRQRGRKSDEAEVIEGDNEIDAADILDDVDGVDYEAQAEDEAFEEELSEDLEEAVGADVADLSPDLDEDELISVDVAARSLISQRESARSRRRAEKSAKPHGPIARLYRGETRFDFVGRRRVWFSLSTLIIVLGVISIVLRGGLNLGIEFKGGTEWTVPAPKVTQTQVVNAIAGTGIPNPIVELLGTGSNQKIVVQADLNKLSTKAQAADTLKVEQALAKVAKVSVDEVENGVTQVGPTWGSQITNKAIEALVIFFIVVAAYISIRFEPKMALAAFIAMLHDILVAVGVYSLFNFQVTPDTVVAILTILGYSLYDTVVVFDRVRDNTKGIGSTGRLSYTQIINLSMNQTLARSINTSLVAIFPVFAVLTIGAEIFGATTLQDYGLALFVGLVSGAYSSIFIASPILCLLKERESRWTSVAARLAQKGARDGSYSATDAASLSTQLAISAGGQRSRPAAAPAKRAGPIRPGSGTAAGAGARNATAGNGRPVNSGASAPGGGGGTPTGATAGAGAGSTSGSRPGQATATGNRPAPRPRKGKGKGKRRR
jgi:preprotein translocase subunit SecF